MRLPELLSGRTMTSAGVLRPLTMSQSWKEEGESTATITMPPGAPELEMGAWVRVYSPNGAMNAVMYVKSGKTDYVTGIRTYTLEHCFQLLQEMIIFGEIKPADMGGSETEVSAATAIRYLIGRQTQQLFQVGTIGFDTSQGWSFRNTEIHAALMDITESIDDCTWTFDMSSLPWTINLVAYPTQATVELRQSRNLSTMTVNVDKSKMYTRAYPVGQSDLHISGDYIERNTGTYGVIGKVITEGSISDEGHLRAWALKQLKRNSVPYVSISISGAEFSRETGESLDRIITGKICRVPLPKYGDTFTERITEVSWKNCMLSETECTVTMANERKTVQGVLNSIASGGGAGSTKSFHAGGCKLHDHDDELGDHWTQILRNDYYIRLEAYERVNGDNYNYSYIEQTANYIRSEVGQTANGLYSRIEQTARYIRQEVSDTANGLYSRIEQTASSWSAVVDGDGNVTPASITLSINNAGSSAKINADKIYLLGQTIANQITAEYISSKIANIPNLQTISLTCNGNLVVGSGYYAIASHYYLYGSPAAVSLEDAVRSLDISRSGNTYTLRKKSFNDSDWVDVDSFSRAVTSASWSWVNGAAKVSLQPQSQEYTSPAIDTYTLQGNPSYDSSGKKISQNVVITDEDGNTVTTIAVTLNAIAAYRAGWNDARAKVTRSGDTIYRPAYMNSSATTGTNEQFVRATVNLDKGSAWGKAKSQYRITTPGGSGAWIGEKDYGVIGEYQISSTTTLEYRSTGGYWGWTTEPSASISWGQ